MCDIDRVALEPTDSWAERTVKAARKEHVCSCCDGRIARGEAYLRHFSIIDGEPCNEAACTACVKVIRDFEAEHGTRANPGYMRELIENCIDLSGDAERERWTAVLAEMTARGRARTAGSAS